MSTRPSGRVTIAHVAAEAGVSRATVSRVMNGLATVDPAIGTRVRAAAEKLNYTPNTVARSLAIGRTQTVAIVVPDLANPMFQETLRGLSRAAAKDDYRVLVADSVENPEEEVILAREARRRCDGLVLVAPRMDAARLDALLPELAPVVLVNRSSGVPGVPVLAVDYASGIRSIIAHLSQLGHRRIAYVAGPSASAGDRARREGLQHPLPTAEGAEIVVIPCGAMFEDGYAARDAVMDSRATAAVCFNDLVAMGLLGALHEAGVAVPEQLSVTGFDDIQFARYTVPALTTASVPQNELGEQAWQRLRALLDGREPDEDVDVKPHLEPRASTGPAPGAEAPAGRTPREAPADWMPRGTRTEA
ncbi:LacI family DNA-binding transcriptional regulator [Sinomonas sp. ASV486]|uniref:LacI family DNA-binding transcriptional regulator n=1 Tax=Sinomonas sp. ASV486 TaxID=3051170 RepID=UPI0027DB5BCB|nr:LacI family DNA-binding transcriptional regulator [Sinomonas sp. ASV486]MDQ4492053.1 LacI family DNA-binding transcriptional regulator [Sinomonas sp. ASV486]